MSKKKGERYKKASQSLDYWTEHTIIEFTEELTRLMKENNVTRAELAKRIDSSPAYITKVLCGNVNFTLKTMTKLAMALKSLIHVHLASQNVVTRWREEEYSSDCHIDTSFFSEHNNIIPITLRNSGASVQDVKVKFG